MRRQRQGIRSTKDKTTAALNAIETERDFHPPREQEKMNHLFARLAYVDRRDGTIYTDLTGKFPIKSIEGMVAIFILYDWTTNAILATPIPDASETSIVSAFKQNIEYLAKRGFKPTFNVMDNVASAVVKSYLEEAQIGLQLVARRTT